MRLIGTLASQDDALTFTDYLITIGMPAHVDESRDGAWQVWIERDDDLEQGQLQLRAYAASPNDPKYAGVAAKASAIRKEAFALAQRRQKNFTDVRTSFASKAVRPAVFSIIFVVACILAAILTKLGTEQDSLAMEALRFQPFSAIADPSSPENTRPEMGKYHASTMFSSILKGEVWRLVTPIFIHFGLIPLLFNMMWVTSLGSAIERIKGPKIFFALVICGAVFGNVGEALWAVYGFGNRFGFTNFGGFSGVVYAFFGYAWLKGKLQPYEGLGVSQQTVGMMLAWLVICMIGVLGIGIANAAHVIGLIVGVIFGAWPTIVRRIKKT